jgi:acetyl esterase
MEAFYLSCAFLPRRDDVTPIGKASHGFFDWKSDAATKATFKQYGVYYAAEMKAFFEAVLS